jgi:uncharacterized membrane protein (DUF2068 family)
MAPVPWKAEPGLRLIIAYKLVKGGLVLLLAAATLVVLLAGQAAKVHELAQGLRHHVVGAWSIWLSELMAEATTTGHLRLVLAALTMDGSLTLVEGYGLHRRWVWAGWLVVIATSLLLPFEVAALVREVHLGRVLVLIINVAVVAYLGRRAFLEHAAHRRLREAGSLPP